MCWFLSIATRTELAVPPPSGLRLLGARSQTLLNAFRSAPHIQFLVYSEPPCSCGLVRTDHEPPELGLQEKLRSRVEHSRQRSPQTMRRIARELQEVDEKIEAYEREAVDEPSSFVEPALSYLTALARAHGRLGLINHFYSGDMDEERFDIRGEISGGLELLTGRHFPADMLVWVNVQASKRDRVRSSKR